MQKMYENDMKSYSNNLRVLPFNSQMEGCLHIHILYVHIRTTLQNKIIEVSTECIHVGKFLSRKSRLHPLLVFIQVTSTSQHYGTPNTTVSNEVL